MEMFDQFWDMIGLNFKAVRNQKPGLVKELLTKSIRCSPGIRPICFCLLRDNHRHRFAIRHRYSAFQC
jgi:hypothetical protein